MRALILYCSEFWDSFLNVKEVFHHLGKGSVSNVKEARNPKCLFVKFRIKYLLEYRIKVITV